MSFSFTLQENPEKFFLHYKKLKHTFPAKTHTLVPFLVVVIKYPDKSNLMEKWLTMYCHSKPHFIMV